MLLAIDIGNTNMEFGIFDGEKLRAHFRLGTKRDITSDEVGLFAAQFFSIQHIDTSSILDVVITSVVPQINYSVAAAVQKYFHHTPYIIGENLLCPVKNEYDNPSEVGADRLVDAYAAFMKYGGPLIIVDFGTATTCEAVSEHGAYLGGMIYPGIKISMDALFEKAAKLPRIELVNPGIAIGKNTVQSMQAGALLGYAGAIENMVLKMKAELGGEVKVVATGGFSRLFGRELPIFDYVDKHLTLEGLRMIYENRPAAL